MPGGHWLTREQALEYLGLSESLFLRCVKAGVICPEGTGQGQRFRWDEVAALAILWPRIVPLLPDSKVEDQ